MPRERRVEVVDFEGDVRDRADEFRELAVGIVGTFSPLAAAVLRNGAAVAFAVLDHERNGNVVAAQQAADRLVDLVEDLKFGPR